jgi:nitrous oxide reductase accessory protein NosL
MEQSKFRGGYRLGRLLDLLAIVVFMQGCSSQPTVAPQNHPLEQNANNTMLTYTISPMTVASHKQLHVTLQTATAHFQRLDDPAGQWRIAYLSAQHALAQHNVQALKRHVDVMQLLGTRLAPATVAYANAIMQGHIETQGPYYQRALSAATSGLERAVALTYLERHAEAMTFMDPNLTDQPGSRAFVYYRFAMTAQSASAYQQALAFYQQAQDARGIADVLVRLAKLAAVNQQLAQARAYAKRAASVLSAAGDAERAGQVDAWLTRL